MGGSFRAVLGMLLGLTVLGAGCGREAASGGMPPTDERLAFVTSLFTGAEQYESFNRLAEVFPHHVMKASSTPWAFPAGELMTLPATYSFRGEQRDTRRFLEETDTAALYVVSDGAAVYENYWLTGGPDVHWMSMSVGKSFVSALIGIALGEGLIRSIEDPVTDYVPALTGSAYDGVRIKDLLQMSSGARWSEDYSDPDSDIMRFIHTFGTGASLDAFTASLVREREPGTYNYYNSTDTQALGMLLVAATGQSLAGYAQAKLWEPLGMERDGFWITDDEGMEMAAGGAAGRCPGLRETGSALPRRRQLAWCADHPAGLGARFGEAGRAARAARSGSVLPARLRLPVVDPRG